MGLTNIEGVVQPIDAIETPQGVLLGLLRVFAANEFLHLGKRMLPVDEYLEAGARFELLHEGLSCV